MPEKNEIAVVEITDMTEEGAGIGRTGGYPLFIPGAVPGDVLEALITKAGKSFGYARIRRLITPSPDRTEPRCPSAGPCGGCQLQALSYEAQLRFKERKVLRNLQRIGGIAEVPLQPILGTEDPWYYRNKTQLPVGTDKAGLPAAGYYAVHSHRIVPEPQCCLGDPGDAAIVRRVLDHMQTYGIPSYDEETGRGLVRHLLIRRAVRTGEIMVCLVVNGRRLPAAPALVSSLREIPGMTDISLSINRERTNVILGTEILPLYGPGYITEDLCGLSFRLSPLSFFQVNPARTERLYRTAGDLAGLSGTEHLWDLYCGVGTIGLSLAGRAAFVHGIEIIPAAVDNARENARRNGITNADFTCGRAEELFPAMVREGARADAVIVDPPRRGCGKALLDALLAAAPERLVYISCDSATLARDLKILLAGGYTLQTVVPVDMFPQTVHVETVCLLSKLSGAKHHINVQFDMEELDLTSAESKVTYDEIRDWVREHYGFHVSNLNIAQIKQRHGIIERENYNKPKSPDSRQPGCPEEKAKAIEAALKQFQMI
ncbi:MAG: 23S rRNA (uracil(1939)-C(5))-methyltransferase RlmD [Lachnospiraceae bacterium]|nr:23S rRNA (uracil(1939)-C(5))-methyltransferase RlmD [Lachnospiraceae bacterium]